MIEQRHLWAGIAVVAAIAGAAPRMLRASSADRAGWAEASPAASARGRAASTAR
jgi:hypothetical protein